MVRRVVVSLALAGLVALTGVVLGRIYAGPLLAQLVAGAAIGSVGLSLAVRRLPSWTAAPLSVLLLAGYTVLALRLAASRADLDEPTGGMLADALTNGIPRLLTAMIPVEPTPDTVVAPLIAAWLAGLAGAEVAVRAGRTLLGCVPAAALYAGALYVVGPNAPTAGWPSLAFAALVVVALVNTAAGTPPETVPAAAGAIPRSRTLVSATAGLTVVVALIALIGPWVGGQVTATPVDPRRYVEPPQVDSLDESPLNRISGWALTPDQKLLEVHGTPTRERLRLAVLPDFDGVTWRVGATYRNAGRVLPTPEAATAATDVTEVRQEITVDELTGRLLPVVPTPATVEGARVAYDPATGTLIRPESLQAGLRYAVTSRVSTPDLNLLPTADSPSGPAVARYLATGTDIPDSLRRLADQLADGNGASFDRASAIEEFLATHYRQVADAPSGHAYPNLDFFLFGRRDQGGQRGTSEQFAAAFAVLARLTGLPARVVVGFTVPKGGGTVTAGNALAWPEVLFDELGWVPFDPMPKDDNPRPVEEDFTPKPSTPPPDPSEPPATTAPASSSAPPPVLAAREAAGPSAAVVAGGASGTILLLLTATAGAVIMLRRGQRRRRLTVGPPDDRITGAWHEFTDALRLDGRPVPPHLAATEAAAHAAAPRLRSASPADPLPSPSPLPPPPSLPPLDDLVAGVNTTTFAPGAADEVQAQRAGEQAVAYAEALRTGRSWWRRAWWTIHPGPLRWHR